MSEQENEQPQTDPAPEVAQEPDVPEAPPAPADEDEPPLSDPDGAAQAKAPIDTGSA